MDGLTEISQELNEVQGKLKKIVDRSILLRNQNMGDKVTLIWEDFFRDFFGYAVSSGKEKGQNFFKGFSINKILGR